MLCSAAVDSFFGGYFSIDLLCLIANYDFSIFPFNLALRMIRNLEEA